jgi:hypothetical protein
MNLNDSDRMMQMITGYWVSQIVRAVATYSLADYLANGLPPRRPTQPGRKAPIRRRHFG